MFELIVVVKSNFVFDFRTPYRSCLFLGTVLSRDLDPRCFSRAGKRRVSSLADATAGNITLQAIPQTRFPGHHVAIQIYSAFTRPIPAATAAPRFSPHVCKEPPAQIALAQSQPLVARMSDASWSAIRSRFPQAPPAAAISSVHPENAAAGLAFACLTICVG
jgi:hypothetical protein